jgi:hypothetical protein
MTIKDKEFYDLINFFDRQFSGRKDKEPKELWSKGHIYQDGERNNLFLVFRSGYCLGKEITKQGA